MHQIFMVLSGFSPAHKNCKTFFSDKIFYKWHKYIISLQNIILLKWPFIYWLICNCHSIDMYTVYDVLGMYFKVVI